MGLNIYAYSGLKLISSEMDRVNAKGQIHDVHIETQWKDFAPELDDCSSYTSDDCHKYNIGPYSSYRVWRNDLANLAGYTPIFDSPRPYLDGAYKANEGPFLKLLQFSDCSSYIGCEISKSLYEDFAKFDEQAKDFEKYAKSSDFYNWYSYFKNAFEIASKNGAVKFN